MNNTIPKHILPVLVFAQLAGTSLWFASNAILKDLIVELNFPDTALTALTSSVQLGFIVGTLFFSVFALTDKLPARYLFTFCALSGAVFNAIILLHNTDFFVYCALRFLVGITLAGIYPVGMKIAADWYSKNLGNALGYLVGALVLGTALPHALRALEGLLSWRQVLLFVSLLASCGALLLLFTVPEGPHKKAAPPFDPKALFLMFRLPEFRAATFGYFGHMWELYTFWAFVPIFLNEYQKIHSPQNLNNSLWSGIIISVGGLGCVLGGLWSKRVGSARVAFVQLCVSGLCCLCFPLFFDAPLWLFLGVLLIWGAVVVGDSPQLSTLAAQTAPPQYIGSALTIMNCIGFSITIASLWSINQIGTHLPVQYISLALCIGPLLGTKALFGIRAR